MEVWSQWWTPRTTVIDEGNKLFDTLTNLEILLMWTVFEKTQYVIQPLLLWVGRFVEFAWGEQVSVFNNKLLSYREIFSIQKASTKRWRDQARIYLGGPGGLDPCPFFDTVQIVPLNSSTNLEQTLWKISLKSKRIHQNDVPAAFSWSFQRYYFQR